MFYTIRGMHDRYEKELVTWRYICNKAINCFLNYGYQEIKTPILEDANMFIRGVGEFTDIIEKEMYLMEDKNKQVLALRPEGTSSVVRSIIEHNIVKQQDSMKYFYIGPMFRRERPQKGRLREFYQIGAEVLGSSEAYIDVESIFMLMQYLFALGLNNLCLCINSLGTIQERNVFTKELYNYFLTYKYDLCNNCRRRIEYSVLRILDCKYHICRSISRYAPKIIHFLRKKSLLHFNEVTHGLRQLNIPYRISYSLVRGLDYYTNTVFEITYNIADDIMCNVLAAGGRYNNLSLYLGNIQLPAFGFSAGIERIYLALKSKNLLVKALIIEVYLIYVDYIGYNFVFKLAMLLRQKNINVALEIKKKSVKSQMRLANKMKAKSILVIGKKEIKFNIGILKMLFNNNFIQVKLDVKNIIHGLCLLDNKR